MLQRLAVLLCAALLTTACGQSDAGISTAIKTKFAADDMVKAYQIDVDTQNRVVTLTGDVETSIAKDQALKLARETDGVSDVVDKLSVRDTAATSGVLDDAGAAARDAADRAGVVVTDAAVTSAVKAKLLADTTVGGLKIDVDTTDGVVTLTGDVASKAEANEAMRLARGTEGVRSVVDKLRVTTQ
jgi:hyperosmotically inducible protein